MIFNNSTEDAILVKIAQNQAGQYNAFSTEAFSILFKRYKDKLLKATFRHLYRGGYPENQRQQRSEEIVQDVFIETGINGERRQFFTRFVGFHVGPTSFERFLQGYRRNITSNALKKYWSEEKQKEKLKEALSESLSEADQRVDARKALLQLIASLSEQDLVLLGMKTAEYSHQEIAVVLNISLVACRKRSQRLREKIERLRE